MVGGSALKQAIHIARAKAGIVSDMQLALRAHVHYDTLMNWYSGKTTPRPHELKKVATTLDMSYGDLMAAYEGRDPEPPALADAVNAQTEAIRDLIAELREDRVAREAWTEGVSDALARLPELLQDEAPTDDPEPAPLERARS